MAADRHLSALETVRDPRPAPAAPPLWVQLGVAVEHRRHSYDRTIHSEHTRRVT